MSDLDHLAITVIADVFKRDDLSGAAKAGLAAC
jgi:hypothetical protein